MAHIETQKLLLISFKIAEGRDNKKIDAIAKEIELTDGVLLLDLRKRPEQNYTIIKFVGSPDKMIPAFEKISGIIFRMINYANCMSEEISGSLSTIVFIPINRLNFNDCKKFVTHFGDYYAKKFNHAVFYFSGAARKSNFDMNKRILAMKKEKLSKNIQDGKMIPDNKIRSIDPEKGITLIGIRKYIITIIFYLDLANFDVTQDIADELGSQGRTIYNKNGFPVQNTSGEIKRKKGRFKTVETIAVDFGEEKFTQIICNLTDYQNPTLVELYDSLQEILLKYLVDVVGSSIMGYIPLQALETAVESLPDYKRIQKLRFLQKLERLYQYLKMDVYKTFSPSWQIIDYRLKKF